MTSKASTDRANLNQPPSGADETTVGESAAAALEFSKYRRPELTERVAELVSVPATIGAILQWGALAVVVAWVGLPLLFADRVHWTLLTAMLVYGTVAGLVVGLLLGIAAKLSRSLNDVSEVVATSIDVAEQVSVDVAAMRSGTTAIPTGEETLNGVYEHVVLPAVKAALTRNTWLVGQVTYWLYHWTLDRVLKRVIRAVGREDRRTDVNGAINHLDTAAERAAAWLTRAHRYVDGIGNGIRRIVGVPIVLLLTMFFVLLALPLVVIWWLT